MRSSACVTGSSVAAAICLALMLTQSIPAAYASRDLLGKLLASITLLELSWRLYLCRTIPIPISRVLPIWLYRLLTYMYGAAYPYELPGCGTANEPRASVCPGGAQGGLYAFCRAGKANGGCRKVSSGPFPSVDCKSSNVCIVNTIGQPGR